MRPNAKPVPEPWPSCQRQKSRVPSPTKAHNTWNNDGVNRSTPPPDRLLKGNKTLTLPPLLWTHTPSIQAEHKSSLFLIYNIQTLNTKSPFQINPSRQIYSDSAWPYVVHTCFVLKALSYKTWQTRLTDEVPALPSHLHRPISRSHLQMVSDDKSPSGGRAPTQPQACLLKETTLNKVLFPFKIVLKYTTFFITAEIFALLWWGETRRQQRLHMFSMDWNISGEVWRGGMVF